MEQYEIEEKLGKGYIQSHIIIELLGAPKAHVEKTLALVLKKLEGEKDLDFIKGEAHPPKEQDEGKLFSTFAEVEVLFKNFEALTRICFDYMPSSIEILAPSDFKLSGLDVSNLVSDMLSLLHQIDFKLKDANAKNQILERNSTNLLKNIVLLSLGTGRKSTSALSKATGINPGQLEPFLQAYAQENRIRKNGDLWEKI